MGRLRRLWELWQSDNPLLRYYDPRRRNLAGLVFRLGELYAILAFLWLVVSWMLGRWLTPGFMDDYVPPMVLGLSLTLPALFLFVAPGPWPDERSRELLLTRLTAGELAFGFLFWPLVFLALVSLGSGMALLGTLNQFGEGWLWYAEWMYHVGVFMLGAGMPLALGGLTMERWYTNSARRWAALFMAPIKFLPPMVVMASVCLMVGNFESGVPSLLLGSVAMVWGISRMDLALRNAGWRILGTRVAPEALLSHHPMARERALSKFPGGGWSVSWKVMGRVGLTAVPVALLATLFFAAGQYALGRFTPVWADDDYLAQEIIRYGSIVAPFASFLVVVPSLLLVASWLQRGKLPVCSGALLVSHGTWTVPLTFALTGLILLEVRDLGGPLDTAQWVVTTLALGGVSSLLAGAVVLLMIPRRGRWRAWVILTLLGLAITGCLLAAIFRMPGFHMGHVLMPVLGAVGMCLLFQEWLLHRVARLELVEVPMTAFNTDPPTDAPMVPEWLVDRLAAGK